MKDLIKTLGATVCVLTLLTIIVLLIIGICHLVVGATNTTTEQATSSDEMLIIIEKHTYFDYLIVYDKDTKIMYYQGIHNGACLHPLYNPDGTFKLYNGGN